MMRGGLVGATRAVALAAAGAFLLLAPGAALAQKVYVANNAGGTVTVFNSTDNTAVGLPITVTSPVRDAVTPDGSRVYVSSSPNKVAVIDTATATNIGSVTVGTNPQGIAITPDGSRAYVVNQTTNNVSVIDTATNTTVGSPITVGTTPSSVAISPDGSKAYVTNMAAGPGTVSVINTQTNTVVGSPIPVGNDPRQVGFTPDGTRAYTANLGSGNVTVINATTNTVSGGPITVGTNPNGLAVTPDGRTVYVANTNSANVTPIDVQTATAGTNISDPGQPVWVGISPNGKTAYVTNITSGNVQPINTATNTVGTSIPAGGLPIGIAVTPDQAPNASFTIPPVSLPNKPVRLDAGRSTDSDGTIASFDWGFGDGASAPNGGATQSHTYAAGTYRASLTLTDNDGCSTKTVYAGQTAYCFGPNASLTKSIKVADFSLRRLKLNEARGTATLSVRVPGAGKVALSGKNVVLQRTGGASASRRAKAAGTVKLTVKAKGKARLALKRSGKVRLKLKVTYTPQGAEPGTKTRSVKLKRS